MDLKVSTYGPSSSVKKPSSRYFQQGYCIIVTPVLLTNHIEKFRKICHSFFLTGKNTVSRFHNTYTIAPATPDERLFNTYSFELMNKVII